MKKDIVKEYFRNLSDEDFKFLYVRSTQRLCGDLAEIIEMVQRDQEMDKYLSAASSNADFFARIDSIDSAIQAEARRRSMTELKLVS